MHPQMTATRRVAAFAIALASTISCAADDAAYTRSQVQGLLGRYCVDCHSADYAEAGFRADDLAESYDPADAGQFARLVKAHDRLASGEMPPSDADAPNPKAREAAIALLDRELTVADRQRQLADGRTRRRRLTRTEYEQTVQDLLKIDMPLASSLPGDAVAHGFDKTADALGLSSVLMRQYLEAAGKAVDAAIELGDRPERTVSRHSLLEEAAANPKSPINKAPMFLKGEDAVVIYGSSYCPSELRSLRTKHAGRYRITISAYAYRNGGQATEPVAYQLFGGPLSPKSGSSKLIGFYEAQPFDPSTDATPHPLTIEADLPERATLKLVPWDSGHDIYKTPATETTEPGVALQWVEVEGPLIDEWPPASQRVVFGDLPIQTVGQGRDAEREVVSMSPRADAARLLGRFAERAFRRPVGRENVQPFVDLVNDKLDAGASFTEALPIGYQAILCDPLFLTVGCDAGREELSCYALASRMSLFLWGTGPDDELLTLATDGSLCQPDVLRQQARRMLADERSDRFVRDFASQWLDLAWLDAAMPDPELFPEFDQLLRDSMEKETLLTLAYMFDENRPAREIADADWAFLNERMAIHYGLQDELDLRGIEFERVRLPSDSLRGGFLTQATISKVTANGTHTTPVYRGFWVLDAILGQPTPPPPPNIPAVEPDVRGATTIREMLAAHRADSACAVCHDKLDPAGFAMEALDVIGTERKNYRMPRQAGNDKALKGVVRKVETAVGNREIRYFENLGQPVASDGVLPDGREFADLKEFKRLLAEDDRQLARAFAEKLVVYGTGEGVSFCDRDAIEEIVSRAEASEYGLASLLEEVVASVLFRRR